jgi:hypothetical protein
MAPLRLEDFKPLNPAEDRLAAELGSGDFERLGDGLRRNGMTPPEWSARN